MITAVIGIVGMEAGTTMYLKYLMAMLDRQVCIYFALLLVWRARDPTIEYDSI